MSTLKRYALANPASTIPMPDRGFRLFSQARDGENIDTENRFYASLIADGDIVEVAETPRSETGKSPNVQPADSKRKGKRS